MKAQDFLKGRRWINGPEFLSKSKEEWPQLDEDPDVISADDPACLQRYINHWTLFFVWTLPFFFACVN